MSATKTARQVKDTGGTVLVLAGVGIAAYLVLKTGVLQTIFGGLNSLSSGIGSGLKTLTSGQAGTAVAQSSAGALAFSQPGATYNATLGTYTAPVTPTNAVSLQSTWNPEYATGVAPSFLSNILYGSVAKVNVSATNVAFSNIGLTTTQVEQLQTLYPNDVNGIVMALKNGTALTATQQQELASVGYTMPGTGGTNINSGVPLSDYTSGVGPYATGEF